MSRAKNPPRRRCSTCRKWFCPALSAIHHQKTCSPECRRKRLRRLARRRRAKDLEGYREDERRWQADCRARRRERSGTEGVSSRSGLFPEVMELKEVILKVWDKAFRQSRSRLGWKVLQVLRDSGWKLGQGETESVARHTTASAPKPLSARRIAPLQ